MFKHLSTEGHSSAEIHLNRFQNGFDAFFWEWSRVFVCLMLFWGFFSEKNHLKIFCVRFEKVNAGQMCPQLRLLSLEDRKTKIGILWPND